MQLRSTTPLSYSIVRIVFIVLASVLFVMTASTTNAESDADREKRIKELSREIDKSVSSSRELTKQSESISSQVEAAKSESKYLESLLAKNRTDQTVVEKNIAETERMLARQRVLLGETMTEIYINDQISPIELLASSDSISDYIDEQEIRQRIETQLAKSIKNIKQATKRLASEEAALQRIAGDQQNQKIAMDERRVEQNQLLEATINEAGELQQITSGMAAERKQLQDQQQQTVVSQMGAASLVTGESISQPVTRPVAPAPAPVSQAPATNVSPAPAPQPTPTPSPPVVLPNGGYPAYLQNCRVDANALSYGIDPWGYGCRQCVSYTAWKVLQKTGRPAMYWGNAKMWLASAARVGISSGSQPRTGSVAVMTTGPYGHVAWVESVNGDGTLNVSQYNYWLAGKPNGGWGWYSEFRGVSPRTYQAYIYV